MPAALDRCVQNVQGKVGKSRAFAICTAQLQKTGVLKEGTQELAVKGRKRRKTKMTG